jgi:hypothetical protein
MRTVSTACAFALLSFAAPAFAFVASQPLRAVDYGIFSQGDLTLQTYSTTLGDVFSGGNLNLEFGYGIQTPENLGDMYARGDVQLGSLIEINGRVHANGSVSGVGDFGNDIAGGVVSGPNSVAPVPLPPPTSFTPGSIDVVQGGDFTLLPGAYGDVAQTGLFDNVYLSSGDYYLRSLSLDGHTRLHLDLTGGPINVFVQEDVFIDSGTNVFVNGVEMGGGNDASIRHLASQVLLETHDDVTMDSGFLSYWFGTVFAPFGSVQMDTQEFYGAVIAAGPVAVETYLQHYPSHYLSNVVPEPAGIALAGIALALYSRALVTRRVLSECGDLSPL